MNQSLWVMIVLVVYETTKFRWGYDCRCWLQGAMVQPLLLVNKNQATVAGHHS